MTQYQILKHTDKCEVCEEVREWAVRFKKEYVFIDVCGICLSESHQKLFEAAWKELP